eukprot:scaffold291507_cov56-Attheya_sp.AAC.2
MAVVVSVNCMSSSPEMFGPSACFVQSDVSVHPRNGSGSRNNDFCLCSKAAVVRLCWNDLRSCVQTRYWNGSMPVNLAGMVMASAMGSAKCRIMTKSGSSEVFQSPNKLAEICSQWHRFVL